MIIYCIPGLGCTEKLFSRTKIKNIGIIVLEWPAPEEKDTMESYAKKFLPQINQSQPFCLLGVSLGGMLCTELSHVINPYETFLISSAKGRHEFPWYLKMLRWFKIQNLISDKHLRKLAYDGKWFIGFDNQYADEYLTMINSMVPNYFKYCLNMIINWKRNSAQSHIVHIHGTADKILLYKNVKSNYAIKGGGHAMILFNAVEINSIIDRELV